MQKIIEDIDNFVFDTSSGFEFDKLNETNFLKNLIYSLQEFLREDFDEYLFIVFMHGTPDATPTGNAYQTNLKKILLFISDESGALPAYLYTDYFAVFKSYLKDSRPMNRNIFNLSLGCVKDVPQFPMVSIADRKISVFFSGNLSKLRAPFYLSLLFRNPPTLLSSMFMMALRVPLLKRIVLSLRTNFDGKFMDGYIRFTGGFKQGISPDEYGHYIANSKIVLCPHGFVSTESFRHFEAMRAGCVIVSEPLPDNYFYNESPIIQVASWKEGIEKIYSLINNIEEMDRLSRDTKAWWITKCSEAGTARYIQTCINQLKKEGRS